MMKNGEMFLLKGKKTHKEDTCNGTAVTKNIPSLVPQVCVLSHSVVSDSLQPHRL